MASHSLRLAGMTATATSILGAAIAFSVEAGALPPPDDAGTPLASFGDAGPPPQPDDLGAAAAPDDAGPLPPPRVLTLRQLEQFAVTKQPEILSARALVGVAEGTVEQARSPFFPQITAVGQYSYGNSVRAFSVNGTATGATQPGTTTTVGAADAGAVGTSGSANANSTASQLGSAASFWDFGLSGTQLVYDFGQVSGRYSSARSTLDSQRFAERTAVIQVLLAVRRAYFTARADKELVDVARETLRDQQIHLTQVLGQVQVGTQPPIALAQQRAAVANAQVQLVTAENNFETSKAQLNQAVGVQSDTSYDIGNEVIPPVDDEEQPLEILIRKALASRPELATLSKQREAQESTVGAIKGAFGPSLAATGSVAEEGLSLSRLQPAWSVGVLLSWPVFQGGLTAGQVRSAEATLANYDAQQALEVLQVRLDVNSAQLAIRAAKATIGSAEDAVTNAREQLRLAEQRYATGVGNIIELNDAQVAYTSAAAQLVQARYSLATARAQLLAALGRT